MADFRTKLTEEVIDDVSSYFGKKVFKTIIPRNIKLSEAPGYGKPIMLYDEKSTGARKYKELTEEILKREQKISEEEKDEARPFESKQPKQ
jgi:chromosome partitioning protein